MGHLLLILAASLVSNASSDLPLTGTRLHVEDPFNESVLIQNDRVSDLDESVNSIDFNAIVKINNCSGSIIRFTESKDSDRALLLTNGHCIGKGSLYNRFPNVTETFENKEVGRGSDFRARAYLLDKKASYVTIPVKKLLYATMTFNDIALYQLDLTYSELEKDYDTKALLIAKSAPEVNTDIRVTSGYWKLEYRCHVDAIVPQLLEGPWVWLNVVRYSDSGCKVKGGTSGSPVISVETNEVVGLNNTGNENHEPCTLMNPCERASDGSISSLEDRGYGQRVHVLYECLDENAQFDLYQDGCPLPKPW